MATVLVVDDSLVDRQIAGKCVEATGAQVSYAAHGREALEVCKTQKPDVVLTDLQMPELDGLQLVDELRRLHPGLPVILMTAYGSEAIAAAALRAGASSYVPKRNLKQDLDEALRIVLATVDAARTDKQVLRVLKQSEVQFELDYDAECSTALISYLQQSLTQLDFCPASQVMQISTALAEALTNAIDHGNLELASSLRDAEDNAYRRLGAERAQQPPYRDRRVHVIFQLTRTRATFIIRDDGPGFDVANLPDPTDPANLTRPNGRGVMLIRTFMDDVVFNEKGNELTMVKLRSSD